MNHTTSQEQIFNIAGECIRLSREQRPELDWLKNSFHSIQETYGLHSRQETDCFLFQKMYGQLPSKDTSLLKIRYWRTGRHVPANRKQCVLLGQALELSDSEMSFLIRGYFDRSLTAYQSPACLTDPSYLKKYHYIKSLTDAYLQRLSSLSSSEWEQSGKEKRQYLRHLYFTDAARYVHLPQHAEEIFAEHISSRHFDSEFTRQIRFLGEIPRRTMLRNLIIFGLPDLTPDILNEQLAFLGYLPLCEDHTLVGGERLDWLLLRLFSIYEKECKNEDPAFRLNWFQECCRLLDRFFIREQMPRLQFMYFKALS